MLTYAKAIYGDEEKQAVMRSLDSQILSGGIETVMFEQEIAKWFGVKHALTVNSGSVADFVALNALGLKRGDEVITTAGGAFPTTINAMLYLGLVPVFVDVKDLCINPYLIENAISTKTKALMFAHTLGFTPDMDKIISIAKKYNLKVVEDVCDAVGSKFNGQLVGTFGDVATISMYPAHHITTGEGGVVLTNDSKIYHNALQIRDWGRDCTCNALKRGCNDRFARGFDHRYHYTALGLNFKITEMQSAFGREQLKRLDGFVEARKTNYKTLCEEMGTEFNEEVSPFAYPVFSKNKNEDMKRLLSVGIDSRPLFSGNIVNQPYMRNHKYRISGVLTHSDRIAKECFFVGVAPHLTKENMLFISKELKKCSL